MRCGTFLWLHIAIMQWNYFYFILIIEMRENMNTKQKVGLILLWISAAALAIGTIIYAFIMASNIDKISNFDSHATGNDQIDEDVKKISSAIIKGVLMTFSIIGGLVLLIAPILATFAKTRKGGFITGIVFASLGLLGAFSLFSVGLAALIFLALDALMLAGSIVGLVGCKADNSNDVIGGGKSTKDNSAPVEKTEF
jgi:hypothetical protein